MLPLPVLLKTVTRTSTTLIYFRKLQFFGSAALNLDRSHLSTETTICIYVSARETGNPAGGL